MKYQEDEIKAYCEEHGLKLIHSFRDEVFSEVEDFLSMITKQIVE